MLNAGDWSGVTGWAKLNEEIDGPTAARLLESQGSAPEFFRLNKDGGDDGDEGFADFVQGLVDGVPPRTVFLIGPASPEDTLWQVAETYHHNCSEAYDINAYTELASCGDEAEARADAARRGEPNPKVI